MSLIDEALKRARMEAAQKAAEGEGLPYPTIPRHLGPRRQRRWLAPAVVAVAVIAGLLLGWMAASRGPRTDSLAARGGTTADAAAPVTSGPATPAEVTRDLLSEAPEAGEPIDSAASPPTGIGQETPSPVSPQPAGPRPVTSGPAGPEDIARDEQAPEPFLQEATDPEPTRPQPQTSSAPPATEAVTDPDSGVLLVLPDRSNRNGSRDTAEPAGDDEAEVPVESHSQQVPLPGGGAIELGGIAWSETGPFALINGRVVSPGAMIEGYTLERIRPGHVVLAGDGRRIQLDLR